MQNSLIVWLSSFRWLAAIGAVLAIMCVVTAVAQAQDDGTADTTPPTITRVDRHNPASKYTNATELVWRYTFSEPVRVVRGQLFTFAMVPTRIDAGSLSTIRERAIAVVAGSGGEKWDVTVRESALARFSGQVGIFVVDRRNITDTDGNPLQLPSSQAAIYRVDHATYEIDNTSPVINLAALVRQPNNNWTTEVTITERNGLEPGAALQASDLVLVNATARVSGTGQGPYSVELTPVADGTISVGVNAGAVRDVVGNESAAAGPVEAVHDTPPVNSVMRLVPRTSPTNFDTLTWRVTFSKAVTGLNADNFTVTGTTATVTSVGSTDRSNPTTWYVTASGGDLAAYDGNVELGLVGVTSGGLPAGSEALYTLDNTAPTVTSIERRDPPLTSADEITWRITVSEPLVNVHAESFYGLVPIPGANFSVRRIPATRVSPVNSQGTSQGTIFDVTMPTGELAGFFRRVYLRRARAGVLVPRDVAGNDLEFGPLTAPYEVDRIAPTTTLVVPNSVAGPFEIEVRFSKSVSGFATILPVRGGNASAATLNYASDDRGSEYSIRITPDGSDEIRFRVPADVVEDAAGNGNEASREVVIRFDGVGPSLVSFTRQGPSPTNADELTWRLTFSENVGLSGRNNFRVEGVAAFIGARAVTDDGTDAPAFARHDTWDVTVAGGDLADFNGVVTLVFDKIEVSDLSGNALVGDLPAGAQTTWTVDNERPRIAITGPAACTNNDPFVVTFTFSEPVVGFSIKKLSVIAGTPSGFMAVNDTEYRVTVTPDGSGAPVIPTALLCDSFSMIGAPQLPISDAFTGPVM